MMRKINVLMGVIGRGNGGLSTYAVRLASLLDPEKFQVTFLSNVPHPFFEKEILKNGGKIVAIPSRTRQPLAHRKAIRQVLKDGYDVCHIHLGSASNIVPLEEAVKAGIPLVLAHSHSASVEGGTPARLLHRANLKKLAALPVQRLACSQAAGRYLFMEKPFDYVPNAIDLDRFSFDADKRRELRTALGLDGCFVVGHVGRLVPIKNQTFLMEVFARLKEKTPLCRLLLCGDGPDEAALKQKAQELGIAEETIFTGNIPDPENALRAMDCFVLPSLKEGLGLVVIEALGTGLPCFVSDTAPTELDVSPLVHFFSLSEDKEALAKKLLSVMGTPRRSHKGELAAAGFEAAAQARAMEKRYLSGLGIAAGPSGGKEQTD